MNNTKISVIIPVYNVEEYLKEALNSVINQSLKDIEIICIDDCSTDNSLNILKEYASQDDRFIILEQKENKGQGPARNRALGIAKGEVIMFLDPDDWYTLDACEKVYNQITKNNNDFVYMNYCLCVQTDDGWKYASGDYHLEGFFARADCPDIKLWELHNNFWHNVNTVCKAYKRDFLEKYNIRYDETIRLCEDVPFFAKCIANADSVSVILDELYIIRNRENSTSKMALLYKDVIASRKMAYDIIKSSKHAEDLIIPYLCYAMTLMKHFERLTTIDKKIARVFYNEIKKFFEFLNKNENIEVIKDYSPRYEEFWEIIKTPYYLYRLKKAIKHLFNLKINDENILYPVISAVKELFKKTYNCEIVKEKKSYRRIITILGFSIKTKYTKQKINYKKKIRSRIQTKINNKQPINVLFLSNEISKWGYSDLYNRLKDSEYFNPKVIVFPLTRVHDNKDKSQPDLKSQYDFYKKQGFDVEYAYHPDKHFYRNLTRYCPDMIFYQQPWAMPKKYLIKEARKYAWAFYTSYSFDVIDDSLHYTDNFHKFLYAYFADSKETIETYAQYNNAAEKNCVVVGYPKLDEYLSKEPLDYKKYWKEPDKFKIIYAPHHSFEEDSLHLATFKDNGKLILELAKSHPETTWVFKPHPRFVFALLKNEIMTQNEIDEYYKGWQEVGTICESGNYIDLFRTSDLMITDCGSFLGEYLPSGKPLIQLVNPLAQFNKLGEKVKSEYYFSNNNEELKQLFDDIVVKKNDYKKESRQKLADEMFDFSKLASDRIYEYLEKKVLGSEKNNCKK